MVILMSDGETRIILLIMQGAGTQLYTVYVDSFFQKKTIFERAHTYDEIILIMLNRI